MRINQTKMKKVSKTQRKKGKVRKVIKPQQFKIKHSNNVSKKFQC